MTIRKRNDEHMPRTADAWFGRMSGPAGPEEWAAFEKWLEVPENAEAYAHVDQTWEQSTFLANTAAAKNRNLERARRVRLPVRALAAGLAGLAILSGAILAGQKGLLTPGSVQRPAPTEFAADKVSLRAVMLSDGSRVVLDRGAAIEDRISAGERRLLLVRGRARFKVAHDPSRPFIVDAGKGSVIAHGTVFDVTREGPEVRVVLLRGLVEVQRQNGRTPEGPETRMLAPGQQILIGASELAQPSRAPAKELGWTNDMIVFDATPLYHAIVSFNRTSMRAVRLEAPDVAGLKLSGAFPRSDPDGFAQTIAATFGLVVQQGPDGTIVLGKSDKS